MGDLLTLKSSALANYDYNDIASGTGIKRFYGAMVSGATLNTSEGVLSDFAIYSGNIVNTVSGAILGKMSEAPKLLQEQDYDVIFQKPQIIYGNGLINFTSGILSGDSNGNQVEINSIVELRKLDKNSVMTRIVSGAVVLRTNLTGSGQRKAIQNAIKLPIPRTKMKRGETMRISIIQFGQNKGSDIDTRKFMAGYGTDPTNRAETETNKILNTTDNTIFIFDCPFKINK